MNFTIGNKIALGFAVSILTVFAVGLLSRKNLDELNSDTFWVTHTVETETRLQSLRGDVVRADSAARGYGFAADPQLRSDVANAYAEARRDFQALRSLTSDNPIQQARLDKVDPLLTQGLAQLERMLDSGGRSAADRLNLIRDDGRLTGALNDLITAMLGEEQRLLSLREYSAGIVGDRTAAVVVYGTLGAFAVIAGIGVILTQSIVRPLAALGRGAGKIGGGDYDHRVLLKGGGEVGRLAELFNRMAEQVGERQAALAEQSWLTAGVAAFAETVQGQRDRAALCTAVLRQIADLTEVRRAALYLAPAENAAQVLTLAAASAGDPVRREWAPGEGLPGQCWSEGRRLLLETVPVGYFKVASALGEAAPVNLLLQPAKYEGRVCAVLELASWRPFRAAELTLLERLADSLAIVLTTLEANLRTEKLLHQAQILSASLEERQAELQEQAERLRRSELQLQEQQEELKQTNEELEQANAEMEQTNAEMEEKVNLLAEQKRQMEIANQQIERSREELEEKARQVSLASKYKSDFLANMSHELRTPLNSLMILSKMLADNGENTLTAKQVQYAQTINSSGGDLLELINEILDLARIEAGAVKLEPGTVAFDELNDFVERTFRHVAGESKVEFKVAFDPALPATFVSDGRRLKQVLKNLLSNAFKFTTHGSVTLDVRRGPAPGAQQDPHGGIVFSVTDTGIGIPPDKQQLIFEAFQQADAGTARKYGGTGLGLTISREIAALLDASLKVKSEVGQGSTFSLSVPLAPRARAEVPRLPLEAKPLPASRPAMPMEDPEDEANPLPDDRNDLQPGDRILLIIEDDRAFADLMMEFAREKKFKVVRTPSARQGLALARKLGPSAITLDLKLPDGDGWMILDQLKHDARTRHIPTHIISVDEERDRGLRQGAVSYLQKPVTKQSLDEAFIQTIDFIDRPIKSLLIVEDDKVQRQSLIDLIGDGDVKSEGVGSAADTFAALERKHFDCIVLDLGLPDMNGFELIREIQKRHGRQAPPIVVYTGRELSREEETELRMISDSIVIKNARSPERLLDETALFLHRVQNRLPPTKRRILEQAQKNDAVLAGRSVLVVDDDVRNIFALTAVLEEVGMRVEYAESGQAALDRLAKAPAFDVVLMDVMMPEMDGFEAIRRIRRIDRFKKLPIISVTAKAMKGDREKCLEAGASDYITKPVEVEQLRSLLRVWLYA